MYGGKTIPVVPLTNKNGVMTRQCIRQWIRLLISKQYNINSSSDEVIFVMLTINLQAKLMKLDDVVCKAYTMLTEILLEKKRSAVQMTELEYLLAGNLFVPNDGNITNFITYLNNASKRSGLVIEPLQLWYYMCRAVSQKLADSQYIHCKHVLTNDSYQNYDGKAWIVYQLPEELEYYCLVTMNSTKENGGYRFVPHKQLNIDCSPRQVLSEEGLNLLLARPETSLCPICYTPLTREQFLKVESPKISNIDISTMNDIFQNQNISENSATSTSTSSTSSDSQILVILKGTVGSGKTTYANKLQKIAQDAGYQCIIEGTDKYIIRGTQMKQAINTIKNNLQTICNSPDAKKIVIIDTCGERSNINDVFGVNFNGWTIKEIFVNYDSTQQDKYLAWSLRNVIRRQENDAVLTVGKSSLPTCIAVHLKKAMALFKNVNPIIPETINLNDALAKLSENADFYDKYLEKNESTFPI
jgi:hypothetical protein